MPIECLKINILLYLSEMKYIWYCKIPHGFLFQMPPCAITLFTIAKYTTFYDGCYFHLKARQKKKWILLHNFKDIPKRLASFLTFQHQH